MTKPSTPSSSSSSSSSTSSPGASDQLPIPVSGPGLVGQLDPTSGYAVYRIYGTMNVNDESTALLATIIATKTAQHNVKQNARGFCAETEYWQINGDKIATNGVAKITVTKSPHSWSDPPPPFNPGQESFSRAAVASWPTIRDNQSWDNCQVESALEPRYALYIELSKDSKGWVGQITFLNKHSGPLFTGTEESFDFTKCPSLQTNSWYWVKDALG